MQVTSTQYTRWKQQKYDSEVEDTTTFLLSVLKQYKNWWKMNHVQIPNEGSEGT